MSSVQYEPVAPELFVRNLLSQLRSPDVAYFPIRHHSPACARHIDRWIREHRPASVIIEGPESFNAFIPALADARCQFPVALYTNFIDTQQQVSSPREQNRFAAYYPLCDYSPELVALRTGLEMGARIRFADLEFAEKILHSHRASPGQPAVEPVEVRVGSLTDDPHLAYNTYTGELARRLGCRDFNELWDHLFEASPIHESTAAFVDRLAAFCAMARLTSDPRQLQSDGTLAREDCMAAAIDEELKANRGAGRKGQVLVVTGGFHTVALPGLVGTNRIRPAIPKLLPGETGSWLIPYSFDRLDALAGYSSGMPSPAFYDRLWTATHQSLKRTNADLDETIADLILDIGELARERNLPSPVSTPDAIATVQMVRQLARLRGHATPQREDVLDGLRGCLVKGAMEAEGELLMAAVEELLAGHRVGKVPPGTGVPPIVDDFRGLAQRYNLPLETIQSRELQLDLYRKQRSREISRLLHQLSSLDVPFAQFVSGPDFQRGIDLERMIETWQVRWTPSTEAGLIEAAVYGASIVEAAEHQLWERILHLQAHPGERSTGDAVALLVSACCMGLHSVGSQLLPALRQVIAVDPQLSSLTRGLTQLVLLQESREPLEAQGLRELPNLMTACFQRACQLVREAGHCPETLVDECLAALCTLRELLASRLASNHDANDPTASTPLDSDIWRQALQHLINQPADQVQSVIVGAAAGILFGEGQLPEAELIQFVQGYLSGTHAADADRCGVLRGLLATSRDLAWNVPEILSALDELFARWDETTFLQALPDLRLAFADLTPQETHRVATAVSELHLTEDAGESFPAVIDPSDAQSGRELTHRVRLSLQHDHLS